MKTFVSILRGINVGGHRKILIADLKALYENLACQNVKTYIQSGNVVFEHHDLEHNIAVLIEKAILEKYGFEVSVLLRTVDQMKDIVGKNPFAEQTALDKVLLVFLSKEAEKTKIEKIDSTLFLPDQFEILGTEIYLFCPNGYGKTKLTNSFFESKLKVITTTRNWKTMKELLKMAEMSN